VSITDANERSNDIRVKSWCDLCERLYENSWQQDLLRFRSNFAFRGLSDKAYSLKNSFTRRCGAYAHLEYHLLRNFSKYAEVPWTGNNASDWRWLTVAQHHGLPTRLLDWTYSPFVAAHFATADTDRFDCDGVIWFADYVKINKMLPSPLSDELVDHGANAFTLEMLEHALGNIKKFDALGDDLVLFFEPPSIDGRIVNQFAFFSVMSSPTAQLDRWLENHPDLYGRIIIPRELKWEIRDKLDLANITERILFPGLDGLASWLKRYYTPRCG
jgi:hypothetical protein